MFLGATELQLHTHLLVEGPLPKAVGLLKFTLYQRDTWVRQLFIAEEDRISRLPVRLEHAAQPPIDGRLFNLHQLLHYWEAMHFSRPPSRLRRGMRNNPR